MSLYKFLCAICKGLLKLIFNVKVVGKENLPKDGSYILCCNHRSYLDPILLAINVKPELTFMAKAELFEKPILGWLIRRLGAFPVNRGKGDTGAIDTSINTINTGKILAIFPEGTRAKDGVLKRFKSGTVLVSHKTGADIVPACIYFEKKLHFRSKIVVRFGELIPNEELGITGKVVSELKTASKLLQTRVQTLLDQGMDV